MNRLFLILCCLSGCGNVEVAMSSDAGTGGASTGGSFGGSVGGMTGSTGGLSGTAGSTGAGGGYPNGNDCTSNTDCASNSCVGATCMPAKLVNGDACTISSQCASGWCHPEMGLCRDRPALRNPGDTCSYDWECSGFCSTETTPNLCHILLLPNSPCIRDAQCVSASCSVQSPLRCQ